jgi:hypothetical protein
LVELFWNGSTGYGKDKKAVKRVAIVGSASWGGSLRELEKNEGREGRALWTRRDAVHRAAKGGNISGADATTDFGEAIIYDDFDRMLAGRSRT